MPKVSIIATFYNSDSLGDYVNQSMKFLLNQTYSNLEIVCVNDGSEDSTLETLEKYAAKDERIKLISKENKHYAQYAKGAGQKVATGEWCFLFDHDDEISLDAIKKAVEVSQKNPEFDIVSMKIVQCSTDGKELLHSNLDINSREDQFVERKITGKEYLQKTVGKFEVHVRGIVKRDLFNKHSFDFSEPLLNADEFVERLVFSEAKWIGNCEGVYKYFLHPNSSAKEASIKHIDIVRTDVLLRPFFIERGVYKERKAKFENNAFRSLVNGIKIFHTFKKSMDKETQLEKKSLLKDSFEKLDTNQILKGKSFLVQIYYRLIFSDFNLLFNFYRIKK